MGRRLFGTDGMRGTVNQYPMVPEVAMRLGLAAGTTFRTETGRNRVVIGKDTRLSGYVFENALTAGFCAAGMDVYLVGPMATPAIAFLTRNMRASMGVVISASHNPYHDNGIKFFDSCGYKLADSVEETITEMVLNPEHEWDYPAPDKVGRAKRIDDAVGRYIVYLKNSFPTNLTLEGMRIVLDCSNGANYKVAPLVLEELGAEVIPIGVSPNGVNINKDCGSLYPEVMAEKVREGHADIGLALDGDADRLIVCDEHGTVLDGDQIMAICAKDMMESGTLVDNTLVATVMSNMALEVFMREQGGKLLRTPVGDRHVVEAMRNTQATMGGEQSGHMVFMNHGTTGDGLLAGLQLLRIMRQQDKPLSSLAGLLELYPQELINVRVERKVPFEDCPALLEDVKKAENELGDKGRVLLRYSGTESLCRVMVEGEDDEQVKRLASYLAESAQKNLV